MSGLEALSMACSVMQVISFTKEVLTLCKDVYDGRPTTDSQMEENTASIQSLLIEMNRHSGSIQQQTKEEKELHAIAQKCNKAAQDLQKEIQEITQHHEPGDWVKAMIAVYTAKSRKRKVAELYDRFCKYQKTLEAHILFRLCSKADAVEIQQREDFANLSDTMKHFISQLAAGHTEIANLIARDGNQTRQQIRKSEARVKQSIIDIHSAAEYEAMKSSLLRSLKYESMNSRRTELKPAHEATYVSIFESLDQDENSTSSSAAAWRNFVQWLQSDKRVFWIQGKPGSGKSTLMKFLLQHKNTQRGVDKWNTNTLIISHFFWKPGNILQKNLKGLLCSLTHQLLSSEHNLVDHVLSQFLLTEHKETIGDWEILELKTIFHSMLIQCKRSIFFLIDGLDEATETETEEIFQFLDSLIDLPNAKLCISSRGEDIFLRKFSVYDGFKLHELTRDDMLQLASIGIPIPDERYQSDFLKDLRNMLVEKAEGIYLWLVIALESVKRGLRNNDAQHEIRLRLSKLPSKLEELFADMWGRLGEDKDIYEKEAARYFSLLILNQSFLDKYSQCYEADVDWRLSSFQLMLATNDKMKANILTKSYQLPVSEINKNCANTTKGISIKTAGLLVTKDANQLGFDSVLEYNMETKSTTEPEQLIQYLENKIDFIHRTLFDFLKETEVGKSILAQSQTHRLDVDLASIILCQLRSLQYHQELQSARRILSQGFNGPLHYFCWCLGEIFAQNSASETNTNIALLHTFEGLFEAGLLPWDIRPKWYPLPCLDVLLLGNPAFNEFIQSRVDDKGTSYATCFLRDFMYGKALRYGEEWSVSDREEYVLSLGGDINSLDICLYCSPLGGYTEHSYPTRPPEFAACESIISAVIKGLYNQLFIIDDINSVTTIMLHECLRVLVAVLERAPNLDQRTSFLLGTTYEGGKSYKNFFEISHLLYTMASFEKEDEKGILRLDPVDTENYGAIIIAEVNLKHLLEHYFRMLPTGYIEKEPIVARVRQLTEMDSSKPYSKARFYVQLFWEDGSNPASMTCHRFINQDFDILSNSIIVEPTVESFAVSSLNTTGINNHLRECERVDFSTLSVLADEKLGVCRLEDVGIGPPSSP